MNKNVNKDVVHVSTSLTKSPTNTYTLSFKHLFSLLEVEFVQDNTTDDISSYYPAYTAKNFVRIDKPYSDTYTLTGTNEKYYFFDGSTPNSFGCIIPNDYDGYLSINNGTIWLPDQINMKDLFSSIEQGRIYKLTITINQHNLQVGNISVEQWTDAPDTHSSITITT
jgi:hypothetical protein